MSKKNRVNHEDGVDRDLQVTEALRSFDPGASESGYWFRFHQTVMSAARGELARRRMTAGVSVSELVVSWSRTVVPSAVLAAAVAAFVLLRTGAPLPTDQADGPLALEDVLLAEVGAAWAVPDLAPEPVVAIIFSSENY